MPQEIFPPQCMLDAVKVLLPRVVRSRVRYYVGFETGIDHGQAATTLQYGDLQNIYFRPEWDPTLPCGPNPAAVLVSPPSQLDRFVNFVHEHVHVLQIQNLAAGGSIGGSWATSYVTCWVAGFGDSDGPDNCFEQEAYAFADRSIQTAAGYVYVGQVAAALQNHTLPLPCQCPSFGIPQPGNLANFSSQATQLGLVKTTTSCTIGDCLGAASARVPVLGLLWAGIAFVIGLVAGFLSAINALSGVGIPLVILGGVAGGVLGALAGGALSILLGVLGGFLGALLGSILGGFLASILNSIIDAITGGDSGGGLNLEMSFDLGSSFGSKYTFERTREQVALAVAGQRLWVAWTGLDAQVNVRVVDSMLPTPGTFKVSFEQSNHCGPAIAVDPATGNLFVAWVGTEGHVNVETVTATAAPGGATVDLNRTNKNTVWVAKSPADATPGLAVVNSTLMFLAWVADPNGPGPALIHLWRSRDSGVNWDEAAPSLSAVTTKTGTAALTLASGQLHLAWAAPDGTLHSQPFDVSASGDLTPRPVRDVGIALGSATKGGPAVGGGHGELFVAWTDPHQKMHLARSDGGPFTDHGFDPEVSRGNAGPGLVFQDAPIVSQTALLFAWTGAD